MHLADLDSAEVQGDPGPPLCGRSCSQPALASSGRLALSTPLVASDCHTEAPATLPAFTVVLAP